MLQTIQIAARQMRDCAHRSLAKYQQQAQIGPIATANVIKPAWTFPLITLVLWTFMGLERMVPRSLWVYGIIIHGEPCVTQALSSALQHLLEHTNHVLGSLAL
jgi:hypothetical protein